MPSLSASPSPRPPSPHPQSPQARALTAALPQITEEMHRINGLFGAGRQQEAIGQFFALASLAIRTLRDDVSCQGHIIPGRTVEISVCRIPAQPRPGKPIALFLPGLLSVLPLAAARSLAFVDLFDVVLCELPGHGASGQVADLSLEAFAAEYAAVIDNALPRATGLTVIGESLGGLVALALGRLRPAQICNVILVDTPFDFARADVLAAVGEAWRTHGRRPYVRGICLDIMGFDPIDGQIQGAQIRRTPRMHDMVRDTPFRCVHILGGWEKASGGASLVHQQDVAALLAADPAMLVTPRISGTGHAVLLDNPDGALAALRALIVNDTPNR